MIQRWISRTPAFERVMFDEFMIMNVVVVGLHGERLP